MRVTAKTRPYTFAYAFYKVLSTAIIIISVSSGINLPTSTEAGNQIKALKKISPNMLCMMKI